MFELFKISLNGKSFSQIILRTYKNLTLGGQELKEETLQADETRGEITLKNWTYFALR